MSAARSLSEAHLAAASEMLAQTTGLHFPRDRWIDLERRLRMAARELSGCDGQMLAEHLVAGTLDEDARETVISSLTVGETYFFRDPLILAQLEEQVLPALIAARRGGERCLRLWSAGASTGEEPYTLAMIVSRLLPDLADWDVTILATDLNPRALRRASEGLYGEWSFRGAPPAIKERFFDRCEDGRHRLRDHIRNMVTFAPFNLVDGTPTAPMGPAAFDVIFCRNVLMYLHAAAIERVLQRFHTMLRDGGWMIVSPSEVSLLNNGSFAPVVMPKTILYRKQTPPGPAVRQLRAVPASATTPTRVVRDSTTRARSQSTSAAVSATDVRASRVRVTRGRTGVRRPSVTNPFAGVERLLKQGQPREALELLKPMLDDSRGYDWRIRSRAAALTARASANTGDLNAAEHWCRQALELDTVNPELHYLLATIFIELGKLNEAEESLGRALTLDENFVVAHLALANVMRRQQKFQQSESSFATVLELLQRYHHDDVLPRADGMTAGRLSEIAAAMAQR